MSDQLKIGSKVRITNAYPPGHIRTPFFLRGKEGTIIRHFGKYPNPEQLAYGLTDSLILTCTKSYLTWKARGKAMAALPLTTQSLPTFMKHGWNQYDKYPRIA